MLKKYIAPFHYLTQDGIPNATHIELTKQACEGGAKWIQLRMKASPLPSHVNNATEIQIKTAFLEIAKEVKQICSDFGAKLIINDYVEIAKEVGADGVHLGKNDMPPLLARKFLGDKFIIGGTANNFADILKLSKQDVDYIGLGPYQYTATKQNLSPILGIEGIRNIINKYNEYAISIPVIAIGGITLQDINEIMNCGVHGIAISGAINYSANRIEEIKKYILSFN